MTLSGKKVAGKKWHSRWALNVEQSFYKQILKTKACFDNMVSNNYLPNWFAEDWFSHFCHCLGIGFGNVQRMALTWIMVLSVQVFGSSVDGAEHICSIQALISQTPVTKESSLNQNLLFSSRGRHIPSFKLFKANSDTH